MKQNSVPKALAQGLVCTSVLRIASVMMMPANYGYFILAITKGKKGIFSMPTEKVNSKPLVTALKVMRKIFLCLQIKFSCCKKTLSINKIKSMPIYYLVWQRPTQKNENKNKKSIVILFPLLPDIRHC